MNKIVFLFVFAINGVIISNAKSQSRISNALPANENQFPYAVSLQKLSKVESDTRGHRCGGALVSLQHAVTAASCTYDSNNEGFEAINITEYRVFSGSVALTNDSTADHIRKIVRITVNPGFNASEPFVHDIAIITLMSPFSNSIVSPVKVSIPIMDATPVHSQVCTVAGWGARNTSATASTELLYLQKSVFDQASCSALYSALHQINVLLSMICASSGLMMPSGCTGDIGNPLVCRDLLTGILIITNRCTASINPEVYIRVSSYYDWIEDVLSEPIPEPGPNRGSIIRLECAILSLFVFLHNYYI